MKDVTLRIGYSYVTAAELPESEDIPPEIVERPAQAIDRQLERQIRTLLQSPLRTAPGGMIRLDVT